MFFQPIEPAALPETLALEANLASSLHQTLSADLLEVMGEEVDTRLWSEDGGSSFQGEINLFGDHWITFDLRSFLLSGMPRAGETRPSKDRAELRALASLLRQVVEEIEVQVREPALADEGLLATRKAA